LGDKVYVMADAVKFKFSHDYKAQGQKAGTYIFHEKKVKTDNAQEVHWLLKNRHGGHNNEQAITLERGTHQKDPPGTGGYAHRHGP
jgi:hypothetical protein